MDANMDPFFVKVLVDKVAVSHTGDPPKFAQAAKSSHA